MKYILLRDDEITLRDKRGQVIYKRLVEAPLHHVTYAKTKHGYHVEEFEIIKEPKGCLENFFFAFRESIKVKEFDFMTA
jgi:hypothetical protein